MLKIVDRTMKHHFIRKVKSVRKKIQAVKAPTKSDIWISHYKK